MDHRHGGAAETRSGLRPIRILTVLLGLGFVAYAASDHPLYGGPPGFGALQAGLAGLGAIIIAFGLWASVPRVMGVFVSVAASLLCLAAFEFVGEQAMGAMVRTPYQYDSELLFSLRPGATRAIRLIPENGGHIVMHEINDDGFRGPQLNANPSTPRIFVYGDSFIHAEYAHEADTFARQLEQQLSAKGIQVDAVNAGVSSYGPDQVAVRLETELKKYQPTAVVLAVFGGNDYGDLVRNKLFSIRDDGSLQKNSAKLDPSIRQQFDLNGRESVLVKMLRRVKGALMARDGDSADELGFGGDTSPTDRVEVWLKRAQEEYEDYVVAGNDVVTNTHQDLYNADLSVQPNTASAKHKADLMRLVLGRIADLCEQANVPLVLLSIPHPMDVAKSYAFSKVDTARFPDYDPRNLMKPLDAFAADRRVPHVNLFDVYRAQGSPRQFYLKGGDDHWNPKGQTVAAEAVAAQLVEHVLRPAAAQQ